MPVMGNERRVAVVAKLEERISSKAVRLSVYGLQGKPIPLQAFDAGSVKKLHEAKIGDTLRLFVWYCPK